MKTVFLTLAVVIMAGLGTSAMASEKTKDAKPTKAKPTSTEKSAAAQKKQRKKDSAAVITGSYIKQDVRRDGFIVESSSPLYVIDNDSIRTSGAADLNQLLVRRGFNR
jgi:hypothetical protein